MLLNYELAHQGPLHCNVASGIAEHNLLQVRLNKWKGANELQMQTKFIFIDIISSSSTPGVFHKKSGDIVTNSECHGIPAILSVFMLHSSMSLKNKEQLYVVKFT